MKIKWGLVLGLLMPVVAMGPTFAATESTLSFTFNVKSVFKLSLSTSQIDFGEVPPGEKKKIANAIFATAVSNTGRPWLLQISTPSDYLTSHDSSLTLPASTLHWKGSFASSRVNGTLFDTRQSVSKTASVVYLSPNQATSSVDNINTDTGGTLVSLDLDMDIPDSANAGTFESVIIFTLTEG